MSTRIRLRRMGANKRPFYRVVVADQRSPRDGRFIENIGKYHPLEDPSLIEIDEDRALHWLRVGAQPSAQVRNLMNKIGIWDKFVAERPSAAGQIRQRGDEVEKPKVSKMAAATAAAAADEAAAPVPEPVEETAPVEAVAAPEPDQAPAPEPEPAPAPEPETAAEPEPAPAPEPETASEPEGEAADSGTAEE
jgi:small subunit ribosomal protein S16